MTPEPNQPLRGKRIAVLAADGFEYVELVIPKAALTTAGAETEIVSLHKGKIRGMNFTSPTRTVRVDRTLDEARPTAYDGLFIPGGFVGPDFLRQSAKARAFARVFDDARKPIATLCHGPWLLASAEICAGRTLASWPGIRDDIVHAGGVWIDEEVVRDGNWVSSRGPLDLPAFIPAMIHLFATGGAREPTRHDVWSSPQASEPSAGTVQTARVLPGPGVRTIAAAVLGTALGALAARVSRA